MKMKAKTSKAGTKKPSRATKVTSSAPARSRRSAGSSILASVHETVSGLHRAGVIEAQTMRKFDELCLEPVVRLGGGQIAELRKREKVSQPVFAKYLNVSKSSVSQWESGEKHPDGAALKLLNLVKRKGLGILA
jgi:putative transcriptional regulator